MKLKCSDDLVYQLPLLPLNYNMSLDVDRWNCDVTHAVNVNDARGGVVAPRALYGLILHDSSANTREPRGILLPEFIIKPFKHGNCVLHVFLSLLPPVENRAVFTRAQHILESSCHPPPFFRINLVRSYLVKRPLTSLTLRPQSCELYLSFWGWSYLRCGNCELASDISKIIIIKMNSYLFLIELIDSGTAIIADCAICQETSMTSCSIRGTKGYAPPTLLFARSGVLHPKHVTVFTANFMSPPTVGVAIWMVLVCSPDTITTKLSTVHTSK